jgi:hypothetical protein
VSISGSIFSPRGKYFEKLGKVFQRISPTGEKILSETVKMRIRGEINEELYL